MLCGLILEIKSLMVTAVRLSLYFHFRLSALLILTAIHRNHASFFLPLPFLYMMVIGEYPSFSKTCKYEIGPDFAAPKAEKIPRFSGD